MEEVNIYPSAYVKPYLYIEVRVIRTAPRDIRGTGIVVAPDYLVSACGGVLPA
jgi:hypothetical protein